jgi:quercetin 2,3-dioxygenase
VVRSEVGGKSVTTRTTIPTVGLSRWPPFERVAETIATPRRRFPPHRHEGVEVLTYVIEGSGTYELEPGSPAPVSSGSAQLLTAPSPVSHVIHPAVGQTVRWFAVVASLPTIKDLAPRLQAGTMVESEEQPDGTAIRKLVGPDSPLQSEVGLDCEAIRFLRDSTSFQRVGHQSIAICYALSGRGTVDNEILDAGEAALVQDSAGIALEGRAGFQVILVRAPRPPP